MDQLSLYEAKEIFRNLVWVDVNQRMADRYLIWASIQPNCKEQLDLKDIYKLPWDDVKKVVKEYDEEEDKRLEEQGKWIEDAVAKGLIQFNHKNTSM